MRHLSFVLTAVSLAACFPGASIAGSTYGSSQQYQEGGSNQSSSSSGVSENRMVEILPPLAKDAILPQSNVNVTSTAVSHSNTSSSVSSQPPAPVIANRHRAENVDSNSNVQNYVWLK
jgi:hypothetical protein